MPEIEVFFEVIGSTNSFIESIFRKNYSRKAMYLAQDNHLQLWAAFDEWSSVPSPLPPYTLPPLNKRVWAINASAVRTASGRGIIFVAPPYQGKSTIANAIVQAGGAPLSDNVTMLDRQRAKILPYLTPTGIREETLKKLPGLEEAVANMHMPFVTVSEVTGTVYLLHFDEIQDCAPPIATDADMVVLLRDVGQELAGSYRLSTLTPDGARHRLEQLVVDTSIPEVEIQDNLSKLLNTAQLRQLDFDLSTCDIGGLVRDCFG
ncbi:hypothetical protein ABMC88_17375 [Sulfitobacter sp. HNIBRBA2951]|uniref:hypothetical protein n=1 Tax=Sulfitobacter aquimarinus TaxID=3158557 RepID=UPI0032E02A92